MSNTPVQELPSAQDLSSGSGQTFPSRPLQPISDPSASKRVCFYKSGDNKFSGHRMVINGRMFKTFDALLDALSKKVPLPFGVRTITTPRGTHLVRALDDLQDGGSYVCSDQKRVKPLNLEEVNRRQVPWNTRPFSTGRRRRLREVQFGRRIEASNRPAKVTERVAVRTPKKLVVIKNRDPNVRRTIVLQRRTAPTFDALLDYLSQILQFPVLKLFSTDGSRVDGLAALILCSGVVVAAGNESFRLGNYSFQRMGQITQALYTDTVEASVLQPRAQNNKSFSSGRGSRNFSLSSERYIADQINKSRNESLHHHDRSFDTEVSHRHTSRSRETRGAGRVDSEPHGFVIPQEDDIEKSFRVNQDGSMTVEMKVHLTIKEEELLHWTTTLCRSSLTKRKVCASISESGNSSPDSNNAVAKDSSSISENETKEENHPPGAGKGVGFNDQRVYEGYTSMALGKTKTGFKRTPTPGPRQVKKKASVESVKTVTESGVQESTLGHYSYMERTADGETTEGYCVVRHSSSSSNRPIPKPRRTASAGTSKKGSHSSIKSSGVAEVLQIQNNGMEVTETVMHIYESQGCYDNYFANEEYCAEDAPLHGSTAAPESQVSTVSSSNDCDIDFSTTDSLERQKEEMLSLSSDPIISPTNEITNNLSPLTQNEDRVGTDTQIEEEATRVKGEKKKKSQKNSTSTSGSDKMQKGNVISPRKPSKRSSSGKLSSNTSVGKKSLSSSESARSAQKTREEEKHEIPKAIKDEKTSRKGKALLASADNMKRTPSQRHSLNKAAAKDNGHNINAPTGRPQMKKNMTDILQPRKSLLPGRKTVPKPKSMTESRAVSPKKSTELSESFSMPSLNPSRSEIHQYVENWLEKVSSEPQAEEAHRDESESQTKVVFRVGADSESDEKNECQMSVDEYDPSTENTLKKSASCLSVPLCHPQPATDLLHGDQYARGLCVSMPSVRVDPAQQENRLRAHKSAEAIGPADSESSSTAQNVLSPKAKIKPVLQQLCSSIQCIRRASDTHMTSNLEKSSSLPDFPTQVASVFGSSCKAFLSFLSVMTLRENLTDVQSSNTSEAMLMMESLQKISVIEDEDEQRASLTDLHSRASSELRERWKDFQILRERLESEPLSPKISETEFALDVVSEGGDAFEDQHTVIDELMEELNMPQDLRAQISSTIQQARSFYPVEESTFVETEKNQSDSEEDVEKFVEECNEETKQPSDPEATSVAEDVIQSKQAEDGGDEQREQELKPQETESEVKESEVSETEREEPLKVQESEKLEEEEKEEAVVEEEVEEKEVAEEKVEEEAEEEKVVEVVVEEEEVVEEEVEEKEVVEEKVEEEKVVEVVVEEEEVAEEEVEEEEVVEVVEDGVTDLDEATQELDDDDDDGDEETERDREEVVEEETVTEEKMAEWSEGERGSVVTVEEGTEARVTDGENDDDEEEEDGEELEEGEKEEAEETEDGLVGEDDQETRGNDSVEETDEREGAEEETEDEEKGEEGGGEKADNVSEEGEEKGEEEDDVSTLGAEEEGEEGIEENEEEEVTEIIKEKNEEEEAENEIEEIEEEEEEEEEEETDDDAEKGMEGRVILGDDDVDGEDQDEEEEAKDEVVGEESNEEEEEDGEQEEAEDVVIKTVDNKEATDEEEEEEEGDKSEEGEKCDGGEGSGREQEELENSDEEESVEEGEGVKKTEGNMNTEQTLDEEEEGDEENAINGLNEGLEQLEEEDLEDNKEEGNASDDAEGVDDKVLLEEASYLEEVTADDEVAAEQDSESLSKLSSAGQCEDDKGNASDTVNETEGEERCEEENGGLPHPVAISQELLDFVNSALQSSSLKFTYDAQGNFRIEPDNALMVQTTQTVLPKSRKDSSYGLKRLPSPSTSDLSDYRPETSESGGYQTQESEDIVTESGDDAPEKDSQACRRKTTTASAQLDNSVASQSNQLKSVGSFSSICSSTKASKEDLSYYSAASSQRADAEAATEATQCISFLPEKDLADGVLIDKGRWLLKENHLIRKSPPVPSGMYGDADSTSVDTSQDNTSEDSPSHKTQHSPLAAISSSELEEMAKPPTPKCTYYNMPHGSDSDPFLDDSSYKSGKRESSSVKGRGFRVSPTIDTSKTWASKNGSLSSFTSVEFKVPDRRVHPEGESSAVTQPRRTSSGGSHELQSQDSLDALRVRCGQYCPIL